MAHESMFCKFQSAGDFERITQQEITAASEGQVFVVMNTTVSLAQTRKALEVDTMLIGCDHRYGICGISLDNKGFLLCCIRIEPEADKAVG